ncbi:hypothetical protein UA08_01891 [Talaromyces atroroseus]|uniref:SGNH hydrolase-type esterase domain-containing protein n=1 Tax=Talaromyces atroroseus TaxID=1441469 RepID=A0A1Q5Q9X3_TALAT|nr:hypothetical protein UA08_01891 [Talaromyces atroroseus]OKL62725.1 hypothetical protein UA08_01891 [Talaromyces atroroseus]
MPLNILCFGNSLTAGYWHYGVETNHPYALTLKEQLLSAEHAAVASNGGLVDIDVEGQPGDLVNCPPGRFLERMKLACTAIQDTTGSPSSAEPSILPSLPSDLGYGSFTPEQIFAGLQATYALALGSSPTTKVLALTVPECAYRSAKLDRNRDVLNASILAHKEDRYYSFDLRSALPYHAMDEQRREEIWDDGLHLTDKGYDLMGELIAERLLQLL